MSTLASVNYLSASSLFECVLSLSASSLLSGYVACCTSPEKTRCCCYAMMSHFSLFDSSCMNLHICVVSLTSYCALFLRATGWTSRGAPSLLHSRYRQIGAVTVAPRPCCISLCSSPITLLHISPIKFHLCRKEKKGMTVLQHYNSSVTLSLINSLIHWSCRGIFIT